MQEELLSIIKIDVSSRIAGVLKGDDALLPLPVLNNAADGNLRLTPWVKINEKNRFSSKYKPIVVVKKTFRYPNVFFYYRNILFLQEKCSFSPTTYAPILYSGTLIWKRV